MTDRPTLADTAHTDTGADSPGAGSDGAGGWLPSYVAALKGVEPMSPRIETALRTVPRHLFIETFFRRTPDGFTRVEFHPLDPDPGLLELIYSGAVLVTAVDDGRASSSASEARLVARMLHALDLSPGQRVLEIGTGSGYTAGLLAEIVGDPQLVTTVDNQPEVSAAASRGLARAGHAGVRAVVGDGYDGFTEAAPYDRIIVTAGCAEPSPHWISQLAPGGRVLIPWRHGDANPLLLLNHDSEHTDRSSHLFGRIVGWSGFMPMRGQLEHSAQPAELISPPSSAAVDKPVWPDLYNAAGDGGVSWRWDGPAEGLWFYLVLNDPRTRITDWSPVSFGLVEPTSGASVRIRTDRLICDLPHAEDQELLERLNELHDQWRDHGSPRLTDYQITFHPLNPEPGRRTTKNASDPTCGGASWRVAGWHHTTAITLPAQTP